MKTKDLNLASPNPKAPAKDTKSNVSLRLDNKDSEANTNLKIKSRTKLELSKSQSKKAKAQILKKHQLLDVLNISANKKIQRGPNRQQKHLSAADIFQNPHFAQIYPKNEKAKKKFYSVIKTVIKKQNPRADVDLLYIPEDKLTQPNNKNFFLPLEELKLSEDYRIKQKLLNSMPHSAKALGKKLMFNNKNKARLVTQINKKSERTFQDALQQEERMIKFKQVAAAQRTFKR